jgi:hypothetical protein
MLGDKKMVVVACVVVEGEKVSLKVEKERGKKWCQKKGVPEPQKHNERGKED